MFHRRLVRTTASLCTAALFLGLGTAQAANYSLAGGGAQLHIGGGLALPVQAAATVTGSAFPPLLIGVNPGVTVVGTTAMASQQKITVPTGAMLKPAAQKTVGVFTSNPTLYAVATNLAFSWPAAAAVFSTGARTGAKTTTFAGGGGSTITYSNAKASKFGGPARFALAAGPAAGLMTVSPITIFAIAIPGTTGTMMNPGGNPPCAHPAFGGTNAQCVAALAQALPTGLGAIGGPVGVTVTTPGGTPAALVSTVFTTMTTMGGTSTMTNGPGPLPGIGIGAFGTGPAHPTGPKGTVSAFLFTSAVGGMGSKRGFTNMASSIGYPWTTGMITLAAPNAKGAPETFVLSGMDSRTAGGAGLIQMVSGALSLRPKSGDNANRGWVAISLVEQTNVPTMAPWLRGGTILLIVLLTAGYFTMRPRLQSSTT